MPSTKRTNKKKNQSLLNKLTNKLNLNTTKGRLIVTILSFALIGGGVMVYRSFAAIPGDGRNSKVGFSIHEGSLVPDGCPRTTCITYTSHDGQKNGTKVVRVRSQAAFRLKNLIVQRSNYEFCAIVKGSGSFFPNLSTSSTEFEFGNEWHTVCNAGEVTGTLVPDYLRFECPNECTVSTVTVAPKNTPSPSPSF